MQNSNLSGSQISGSRILVTGAAGFIGFHLSKLLLAEGASVVGTDSINDYYDVAIKTGRLAQLGINVPADVEFGKPAKSTLGDFTFVRCLLEDTKGINEIFEKYGPFDYVVNLGAQAGVRYSLTNPQAYVSSNLMGFLNILEACRHHPVKHLVYASSSSVYGLNESNPFSVDDPTDHPVSFYAATKKANEVMAHSYSHMYGIATSGLRFFTVYGPWGRPDMALFMFTRDILEGKPIQVFNYGEMMRDFTYVDDIVESIKRLLPHAPKANPDIKPSTPAVSPGPFRVYNIGNNSPVRLMDFVHAIEEEVGRKAIIDLQPLQKGDVPATYADVQSLIDTIDFQPATPVKTGIHRFVNWYKAFYNIPNS